MEKKGREILGLVADSLQVLTVLVAVVGAGVAALLAHGLPGWAVYLVALVAFVLTIWGINGVLYWWSPPTGALSSQTTTPVEILIPPNVERPVEVAVPVPNRARTEIFFAGLCWAIAPEFFDDRYRTILNPSENTLHDIVIGPFCPQCANPRRGEHNKSRSWEYDFRPIFQIKNPCEVCGHAIPEDRNLVFFDYQQAVWTEAQRLLRAREDFPPCPHPRA